jgi:hypothetical protein
MVVFGVCFQVLAKLLNARREKRYLNFTRAAVASSSSVTLDYFPLSGGREGHQEFNFSFSFTQKRLTKTGPRVKPARVIGSASV